LRVACCWGCCGCTSHILAAEWGSLKFTARACACVCMCVYVCVCVRVCVCKSLTYTRHADMSFPAARKRFWRIAARVHVPLASGATRPEASTARTARSRWLRCTGAAPTAADTSAAAAHCGSITATGASGARPLAMTRAEAVLCHQKSSRGGTKLSSAHR
jgi:hypothetical protein